MKAKYLLAFIIAVIGLLLLINNPIIDRFNIGAVTGMFLIVMGAIFGIFTFLNNPSRKRFVYDKKYSS